MAGDDAAVAMAMQAVGEMTASTMAEFFVRLAGDIDASDPTTYTDGALRDAAARLAGAIGDQLLAVDHVRNGPRA